MRLITRLFLLIALLFAPAVASARPPVWVVKDADSTIVLFAAVHALPHGLDWRPPELDEALTRADDIWFEVLFDQQTQTAGRRAMLARGLLPQGQHLNDLLSPSGRQRLRNLVADCGLPIDTLNRLQPWFAEIALSDAIFEKAGGVDVGVEQQLLASISVSAKAKVIETAEQQIGFLADAPLDEQVASLEDWLERAPGATDRFRDLVRAWMSGDLDKLDELEVQPLRKTSPTAYAALVTHRSERWTQQIVDRLHGSGRTVLVLSAANFVGKDSVPNRLRALGVQVDGPR